MNKTGDHFLKEVTGYIQSKEAKQFVAAELTFHLKKAESDWIDKGLSRAEAEEKAVQQMGSPIKLGQELNKIHRPKVDWMMVVLLVAAMGLGFLPVLSLGSTSPIDVQYFLINKSIFVILGTALAFGMMIHDYRKLKKLGWLFYIIGSLILLLIRVFPNKIINSAPLIEIGSFTIEPLMAVPFFFLAWASFFHHKRLKVWQIGILVLFSLYLFFSIPYPAVTAIYSIMVFTMLWWSRLHKQNVLMAAGTLSGLFVFAGLYLWPYQREKIAGFLNPEEYASTSGYMYMQLKDRIAAAGWLGASENKKFIPEGHTDHVFVNLTYYYGYFFAFVLFLILSFFAVRILIISCQINDQYGKLLLLGAFTLYAAQLVYHVGMAFGFLPIVSVSLPFISYGLMPTLFNALLIGIVLSVYRRKNLISSSFA